MLHVNVTVVLILSHLDQHHVQMQSMERNGVIHLDVKMETLVSIVTPALSNSSIQKFTNQQNAMTCKQIAIAPEVLSVLLLMVILKLPGKMGNFRFVNLDIFL